MEIGVIGLGRMGSAMTYNLSKAGHIVRAWNRSSGTAKSIDGVEMVHVVTATISVAFADELLALHDEVGVN